MFVFDQQKITDLCHMAQSRGRKRMNQNIHLQLSDPVQRLFNAIQPLSYVQPHRHIGFDTWEAFVLIQGAGVALSFDAYGFVTHRADLSETGVRMVEIPPETFHTVLALEPDTLFFEIKRGPYNPQQAKSFAPWAPTEDDEASSQYAKWLQNAHVGDCFIETVNRT